MFFWYERVHLTFSVLLFCSSIHGNFAMDGYFWSLFHGIVVVLCFQLCWLYWDIIVLLIFVFLAVVVSANKHFQFSITGTFCNTQSCFVLFQCGGKFYLFQHWDIGLFNICRGIVQDLLSVFGNWGESLRRHWPGQSLVLAFNRAEFAFAVHWGHAVLDKTKFATRRTAQILF